MNELATNSQGFEILYELATKYFTVSFCVMLGVLALLLFKRGQMFAAITFLAFGVCLGAGEGSSVYFTGNTISQNWWLADGTAPSEGFTILLVLAALFLMILFHLGKILIGPRIKKDGE